MRLVDAEVVVTAQDSGMSGVLGSQEESTGKRWSGHVVCVLRDRLLIDVSVPQVNEWDPAFKVCALHGEVPPELLDGQVSVRGARSEMELTYSTYPGRSDFKDLEAWTDPSAETEADDAVELYSRLAKNPQVLKSGPPVWRPAFTVT